MIRDDADTIRLATTRANADLGVAVIPTGQGSGTHTLKLSIGQRFAYGIHGQAEHFVINDSSFCKFHVTAVSAGSIRFQLTGGTVITGTSRSTTGSFSQDVVITGSTGLQFEAISSWLGSIDNVSVKRIA